LTVNTVHFLPHLARVRKVGLFIRTALSSCSHDSRTHACLSSYSMPLSKASDKKRSRARRQHGDSYNAVQRASRVKRGGGRRHRERSVGSVRCFRNGVLLLNFAPVRTRQVERLPWWCSFAPAMKRCRRNAPGWSRTCPKCHAPLLDGEDLSFCCNNGKWIATPLPPLPPNVAEIVENSPTKRQLSSRSQCLNNLFCFTA
jgi:hypothetical protein